MAMQEDMEKATQAAGASMKEDKMGNEPVCTCPECGYVAPASEFNEKEPEAEGSEEAAKPGMEVQIEVGKPKMMSAREAAEAAFRGGKK